MTTTTHQRSIHVEAPVEKVFDHVKDPHHFYDAFPGDEGVELVETAVTPEGVGSTYAWRSRSYSFRLAGARFSGSAEAVMTREQLVPNRRIVDHSSTGPYWTFTTEPDPTGTTLSLRFDYSTKVPFVDRVVDRVLWHADRDLDTMLTTMKRAIES